jgi:phosphate-selective porin OprO/OprP
MNKLLTSTALVAVSLALSPAPAPAQDIGALEERIARQEQELQELRRELEQLRTAQEEAAAGIGEPDLEVDWSPFPTLRSPDGRFEATVRGRVQADYGYINPNNPDGGDTTNAGELRRARLGVDGVAWGDVEYRFEADFADNDVEVTDAYVGYTGFEDVNVAVGQFKTPNSIAEQTSSRFITFMERPRFTDAFGLGRRLGVGVGYALAEGNITGGVFTQNIGDTPDDDGAPDNGVTGAARAWYPFEVGEESLIHVGGSFRFRGLDNDTDANQVRYRARVPVHVSDVRYVNTGSIDAASDLFVGGELAAVHGRWSFQSEAAGIFVDRTAGENPRFWGAYGDVGYYLTDNTPNYDGGEFDRPQFAEEQAVFDGGIGAWEVAGRVDYLDLTDSGADIRGGEMLSFIAGLNWWLNPHTRFSLNYSFSQVTDGPTAVNGPDGDNDIHAVGVRAQVDW